MPRLTRTLLSSGSAADPPAAVVTVESDFVVILAALLCALICVVGLIAVARCAFLRRTGSNDNRTNPAANKGVKKKVLNSLPKFTYTTTTAESHTGGVVVECAKFATSECVICIGEFKEGDEIRILPQCGHGFHVGCIDTWLGSHSSCPSCRQILVVTRCRNCGHFPHATNPSSSSSTTVDGGASHEAKASEDPSNNSKSSNCRNPHSNSSHVNSGSFLP